MHNLSTSKKKSRQKQEKMPHEIILFSSHNIKIVFFIFIFILLLTNYSNEGEICQPEMISPLMNYLAYKKRKKVHVFLLIHLICDD